LERKYLKQRLDRHAGLGGDLGDLGVATGALNFFKTLGGAFGAAIFGAILTAQLGGAKGAAIVSGYGDVFFWCVPVMAVALGLAIALREKPLSEEMIAVAAGEAEVPGC
jgi:hypothetical protein